MLCPICNNPMRDMGTDPGDPSAGYSGGERWWDCTHCKETYTDDDLERIAAKEKTK